jgi:hypothetical protein
MKNEFDANLVLATTDHRRGTQHNVRRPRPRPTWPLVTVLALVGFWTIVYLAVA